ncbi:MAG: hypothetical protein IJ302_10320 [Clostridia bacterium]|nr:hypothetical protein [Clostridia bacterium]
MAVAPKCNSPILFFRFCCCDTVFGRRSLFRHPVIVSGSTAAHSAVVLWKTPACKSLHPMRCSIGPNKRPKKFSTPGSVENVERKHQVFRDFQQFPKGFPQSGASANPAFPHPCAGNIKKF